MFDVNPCKILIPSEDGFHTIAPELALTAGFIDGHLYLRTSDMAFNFYLCFLGVGINALTLFRIIPRSHIFHVELLIESYSPLLCSLRLVHTSQSLCFFCAWDISSPCGDWRLLVLGLGLPTEPYGQPGTPCPFSFVFPLRSIGTYGQLSCVDVVGDAEILDNGNGIQSVLQLLRKTCYCMRSRINYSTFGISASTEDHYVIWWIGAFKGQQNRRAQDLEAIYKWSRANWKGRIGRMVGVGWICVDFGVHIMFASRSLTLNAQSWVEFPSMVVLAWV